MKKMVILMCALLVGAGMVLAQDTGGDKTKEGGQHTATSTAHETGKKATKTKSHKGGKKGKKSSSGGTTPPPK
jgi:hypothetical protein